MPYSTVEDGACVNTVTTYPAPDVIVVSDELEVGCPVFDPRTGRLVCADVYGGKVFESDLRTGQQTVTNVGTMITAIAPRRNHAGFVAAVPQGFGFIVGGELEITDLLLPDLDLCMTDGKVDSRGRFWAGSSDTRFAPGRGRLHRWDGTSPSVVTASELVLPAGLGWSADDRVMYLVDSLGNRLYSMPFSVDEGQIGPIRVLAEIDGPGMPTGLCVDVDQCVWVTMAGGGEIRRYSSRGVLVGAIPVPVSRPSGCVFGDDGTLFVTTARSALSAGAVLDEPLAGSIFAVRTRTEGVPAGSFAA
jgi:sugar lactone lactonase YvrE